MKLCHHRMPVFGLTLMVLLSPAWGHVESPAASVSESLRLQQIKQAQSEALARDAEAREACHKQFAINDCLLAQRLRHRAEMQPLQRERDAIESSLRRARAEAQRERVRQRQLEFAASEGERRTESLLQAADAASAPIKKQVGLGRAAGEPGVAASAAPVPHRSPGLSAQARQRQAEQAARQHAQQRAQMEARVRAHQAQVRQRQEARNKPAAAALPVPTAAEIAATLRSPAPVSVSASAPRAAVPGSGPAR